MKITGLKLTKVHNLLMLLSTSIIIIIHLTRDGDPKQFSTISNQFGLDCVGIICEDTVEYDLRIIVLTFDRPQSLWKCLERLDQVDTMGDKAILEIWIDVDNFNYVNSEVLHIAESFIWSHGPTNVHIRKKHLNVAFQWLYCWRPKANSKEIAVIIEDDVDVSQFFYRYLKGVQSAIKRDDISGICLNDENVQIVCGKNRGKPLVRPANDIAFLYPVFCTWGYAPNPTHWRAFQDWYHFNASQTIGFNPEFPEIELQNRWWKALLKEGKADTMLHEMYFLRFIKERHLKSLHPNLRAINLGTNTSFSLHRREPGLHYKGGKAPDFKNVTVQYWRREYLKFPKKLKEYRWDGSESM